MIFRAVKSAQLIKTSINILSNLIQKWERFD